MYQITLIKGTVQYDFIRYTVYFAYYFLLAKDTEFGEGEEVLAGLKEVFDSNEDDEDDNIAMEMNVAGLTYISKLVDFISKLKLEQEEQVEHVARQTEEITRLDIWDQYLPQAQLFFVEIKKMVDKEDWTTIEQQLLDAA